MSSIKTLKIAKALDVAYYFLKLAKEQNKPITNKKLQKLVYYAQVWSLVILNKKLFNEHIEAWIHGPAILSLYGKFKSFEFNPIKLSNDKNLHHFSFTRKQINLLNSIWKVYGKYDAEYLEALTHSELPWQEARKNLSVAQPSNNVIDLKIAKKYYAGILKRTKG